MRRPAKSVKWIPVMYVLLAGWACVAVFVAGHLAWPPVKPATVYVHRAPISPSATLAQVAANFTGKPYVTGQIPELPGFVCSGWTAGATGHGWIVLRCVK